jgi:hypothetical protein
MLEISLIVLVDPVAIAPGTDLIQD